MIDRLTAALASETKARQEADARCAVMVGALEEIANHPHCSYDHPANGGDIGVADGHRCAANIARDALSTPAPGSARLIGIELHCDECQSPYATWFAPSPIWNLVMGGPDCKSDPGGMLCPRCFTLRAEAAGVKNSVWEVRPAPGSTAMMEVVKAAEEFCKPGVVLFRGDDIIMPAYYVTRLRAALSRYQTETKP